MEVAERRASVLAQWSRLKSALVAWRHKLGQSHSLQQFKREADEAEVWMGEKMQTATDDSYKDPTNLPVSGVEGREYFVCCRVLLACGVWLCTGRVSANTMYAYCVCINHQQLMNVAWMLCMYMCMYMYVRHSNGIYIN